MKEGIYPIIEKIKHINNILKIIILGEEKMTKESKRKILNWVLNIIIIALIILGVYLFWQRIFGHSPTDFQLISWLAGLFISVMLKMFSLIYSLNRETGELKIKSFEAFNKIRIDINSIKQSLKIK